MFCSQKQAIDDITKGKFIIVLDDKSRENEGDLILAGQFITPEKMNFMITHAKGLVTVPLTTKIAKKLKLQLMISPNKNKEHTKCSFTISVDAKKGITTGISAHDRAKTVKILSNKKNKATDLVRPGHMFPIISHTGGLAKRQGHTEAAIYLLMLAGLEPVGVMCEILKRNGRMARKNDLILFAKKHKLNILRINQIT